MSAASVRPVRYTREEFVSFERASNMKHEFLDGVIYAMAGGSPEHAAISMNVGVLLTAAVRGRPCRVYSSDLRIRVVETGLETYPDVSVVCGKEELDPNDSHVVTNPVVLVEVLSPSTETYDRGEKLHHYEQIPSLREVVLIDHRQRLVEVHRRADEGRFTRHEAGPGGSVKLVSLGCELPVDEVYRDGFAGAEP
jgi:Uma2 family endonuclease